MQRVPNLYRTFLNYLTGAQRFSSNTVQLQTSMSKGVMFSESGKIITTLHMKYRISFASNLHPFLGKYDSLKFFGKKHVVQKLLPSSGVEGYPTTEKQEQGLYGRYYTRYIYLKDNIYNIKVSKVKRKHWTYETMYLVQFSIECNKTALKNLIADIEQLHCNPHTKYKVIG